MRARRFTWNALLWSLIFPQRVHRIVPTIPGIVLVALSMGIGMAAYNSSSNILFLTLALLLTCLILSGVLSWLNLRAVRWNLQVAPTLRAGHDTSVTVVLRNGKRVLPTYGLTFNLVARSVLADADQRPESTFRADSAEIRAALAEAQARELRGRVALAGRLDPRGEAQLDWVTKPLRRGLLRIELASISSLFPFGFLRKDIGVDLSAEAVVWPAPVEYRRHARATARRNAGDERASRPGTGNDLLAVRRYAEGDSHRLIHWKASARTRQLLVRQFAAESAQGYVVWVRSDAALWPRAEQFELLVSFAATLAEDLFRSGKLLGVAVNDEPVIAVRRLHDLEAFLTTLAVLEPVAQTSAGGQLRRMPNLLTFTAEGARGVGAMADGVLVASA